MLRLLPSVLVGLLFIATPAFAGAQESGVRVAWRVTQFSDVFVAVPGSSRLGERSGRYTFEVQAKGLLGGSSEPGAVAFRVDPPWYRSPGYLGLLALVLASSVGWARGWLAARRREDRLLRETRREYLDLFRGAPDLYVQVELESGRITQASDAATAILGCDRDALLGRDFTGLFIRADRDAVGNALGDLAEGKRSASMHASIMRADGVLVNIETRGVVSRGHEGGSVARMLLRDVTARERLQRQAEQATRLRAVATLSSGIAHEFNNLLAAILGYAELLVEAVPAGGPGHEHGEKLVATTMRAGELTGRMLAFSDPGRGVAEVAPVKEVVEASLLRIREVLPAHGRLTADLCSSQPVLADRDMLLRALSELGKNAAEALRPNGGEIHVASRDIVVGTAADAERTHAAPGVFVEITVRDDGVGIPEVLLDRVLEPFWTTKGPSGGAGLGLAVAHGIISSLGGTLDIESAPGRGTVVRVQIPCVTPLMAEATTETGV